MGWLGRILLLGLGLVVVGLGAALVLLPRMIDSPELRQTLEELLEESIGREVSWRELSLGLLPPSLVIEGARVAGEGEASPPLLRAEEISLRLSIWPLLAGVVLVDSLVVDGAVVELDLGAEGLSLPSFPAAEPGAAASPSDVTVAARSVVLRDAKLVLVDRTRTPPVTWAIEQLRFELEATSPSAPIAFEGGGRLAGEGAGFSVAGQASLAGDVEARVLLETLPLARLAPYAPDLEELSGALSGQIDVRAGRAAPLGLALVVNVADVAVTSGALRIAGDLALQAETEGEGPVVFAADLHLASGGRLEAKGSTTRAGVLEVSLDLREVELALLRLLLGVEGEISGAASGRVQVRGFVGQPEHIGADLRIARARLREGELDVSGPLSMALELSELQPQIKGRIRLDASAARVAWSDLFVKPPEVAARIAGPIRRSASGELEIGLDELVLASLEGRGRLRVAQLTTLTITAPSFDAAPVAGLLPSLADLNLAGRLALQSFGVTLEPLSLSGAIVFEGLSLALPPERGVVVMKGRAEGRGDGIRLVDATCTLGEGQLAVTGGVADLMGQQHFDVQLESPGVLRANPLFSSFTTLKDTIYGPLVVKGRLAGRAGGVSREQLLRSLAGELEFEIGEGASGGAEGGRIKDLSLLRLVFEQLGSLGGAVLLAGPAARGKKLEDFYDDRFRMLHGRFELGDGILATRRLRIVYPDYAVGLEGRMRLVDQSLDMKGRIELGQSLVSLLGGAPGAGAVEIPIASVRGTVTDPKVSVTADTVTALVRQLLLDPRLLKEATRQLDRVLPGVSDILRGGKSK